MTYSSRIFVKSKFSLGHLCIQIVYKILSNLNLYATYRVIAFLHFESCLPVTNYSTCYDIVEC